MGLDDRLGALGAVVADGSDVDADAALGSVHGRARRRRQRRRLVGASIAAAVALTVGGIALALADRDDAQRVTTSPDDGAAPPPDDRSQPYLWLSAELLPPKGGDLAVVIVNPVDSVEVWGVRASVERWDGTAWTPYDDARVCLDEWACPGQIGDVRDVEDIGLSPAPSGPLTWLRTGELDLGWYRLVQAGNHGTLATGQFEVRDDAPALPPSGRDGGVHLAVAPPVRFTSMSSSMATVALVGESTASVPAWQQGTVRIERWAEDRWVAVDPGPQAPVLTLYGVEDDERQATVDLGTVAIEPGAYRLLVDAAEVTIDGRFWMLESDELGWPDEAPGPPG